MTVDVGGPSSPARSPRVGAVVLAAGRSTRTGARNKLLAELGGAPLVRRVVERLVGLALEPVVVVTGHDAVPVREALAGLPVRFVHNDRYQTGMASSIASGIAEIAEAVDGALIALGDMPWIEGRDLAGLVDAFENTRSIVVPASERRRGNPVLWGHAHFGRLLALEGDRGARALMDAHPDDVIEVRVDDPHALEDIDTPEALAAARARWADRSGGDRSARITRGSTKMVDSPQEAQRLMAKRSYYADADLATAIFLALRMEKALFLEGEPGVGKTDVGRVLSEVLGAPLIRLQCYEGLDLTQAVYEWNYPHQLIAIQAGGRDASPSDIFTEEFLLRRPLLQAIDRGHDRAPVLLIDELDRADEEFESFLLELLADYQVTIPELGTFRAEHRPVVVVTSNRTREIHDALKRRCIYHWIDYPSFERELEIIRAKVPEAEDTLARQVVEFVQRVRELELYKHPGVAESLDWARALTHLNASRLEAELVDRTLGLLLKYQDDLESLRGSAARALTAEVVSA